MTEIESKSNFSDKYGALCVKLILSGVLIGLCWATVLFAQGGYDAWQQILQKYGPAEARHFAIIFGIIMCLFPVMFGLVAYLLYDVVRASRK